MNVTKINPISFKGRIIDAHAHLGKWGTQTYNSQDLDVFVKQPLSNGDTIEKMIVSNLSCIEPDGILDELTGNKEILEITKNNSKLAPLAVCQPNLTNGDTKNMEKLLTENEGKFAGLKFHPKRMELAADDVAYEGYMNLAQKHKLPCLFHSDRSFETIYDGGTKIARCEFSRPEQIYSLAKKFPDVPVILGHMGGNSGDDTKAAIDIMVESVNKDSAKIFADISWVNCDTTEKPDIIEAIKRLKNTKKGDMTERLLFGTDAPIGRFGKEEHGLSPIKAYEKVVNDVKNAIKKEFKTEADGIIEKIFYQNADNLFFKKTTSSISKNKQKSKLAFGLTCLIGLGIVSGAFCFNTKKTSKNKTTIKPTPNNSIYSKMETPVFNKFIKK